MPFRCRSGAQDVDDAFAQQILKDRWLADIAAETRSGVTVSSEILRSCGGW